MEVLPVGATLTDSPGRSPRFTVRLEDGSIGRGDTREVAAEEAMLKAGLIKKLDVHPHERSEHLFQLERKHICFTPGRAN